MTAQGSLHQRHTARCPRPTDGSRGYAEHRCRGPWAWHLDLPSDPETGQRRQKTGAGFPTQREAQAALSAALARYAVTGGRGDGLTAADWLNSWLQSLHRASPSTVARYQSIIRLHLTPALGHVPLADLTPEHVDGLLARVADPDYAPDGRASVRYRDQRGLSSSVKRIYSCLHAALAVATRRRLIPWNPAGVVSPPQESNEPGQAWAPDQVARFLDATSQDRLAAAWHLVLLTGARRGEIAGATWAAIDLDAATWTVETGRGRLSWFARTVAPGVEPSVAEEPSCPTCPFTPSRPRPPAHGPGGIRVRICAAGTRRCSRGSSATPTSWSGTAWRAGKPGPTRGSGSSASRGRPD